MNRNFQHQGHHPGDDDTTSLMFDDYQLYIGDDRPNHFLGGNATIIAFGRGGNDSLVGSAWVTT